MRKENLEVWIHPNDLGAYREGKIKELPLYKYSLGDELKATLIIEMPEKKIEITESEFDEILKDARTQYRDTSDCIWHLKQKLFGEQEKA